MKNACIVYDSASNIKKGQFKDVYVLPQQIIEVFNEKETNFKDGVDITMEIMEKKLLNGYSYKTSASNPADAYTLFEKLSKEYKHIYVFLIPNTLSEGQNNVVKMTAEDFPSVTIIPHYMVAVMAQ
jgi:fatty acid-binding protein DegV